MYNLWNKALDDLPFEEADKKRLSKLLQGAEAMTQANQQQWQQMRLQRRLSWLCLGLVLLLGLAFGGWQWLWPLPILCYLALAVPKRSSKQEVATHLILVAALRINNQELSDRYLWGVKRFYRVWPSAQELKNLLNTILEWSKEEVCKN